MPPERPASDYPIRTPSPENSPRRARRLCRPRSSKSRSSVRNRPQSVDIGVRHPEGSEPSLHLPQSCGIVCRRVLGRSLRPHRPFWRPMPQRQGGRPTACPDVVANLAGRQPSDRRRLSPRLKIRTFGPKRAASLSRRKGPIEGIVRVEPRDRQVEDVLIEMPGTPVPLRLVLCHGLDHGSAVEDAAKTAGLLDNLLNPLRRPLEAIHHTVAVSYMS